MSQQAFGFYNCRISNPDGWWKGVLYQIPRNRVKSWASTDVNVSHLSLGPLGGSSVQAPAPPITRKLFVVSSSLSILPPLAFLWSVSCQPYIISTSDGPPVQVSRVRAATSQFLLQCGGFHFCFLKTDRIWLCLDMLGYGQALSLPWTQGALWHPIQH